MELLSRRANKISGIVSELMKCRLHLRVRELPAFRLSALVASALVDWRWDLISAIHRERFGKHSPRLPCVPILPTGSHRFSEVVN